jgi:redox-sensitive bicupin YhaK (pirin superfamily)
MKKPRTIHKVFTSKPTMEGAGVHLRRAFGFAESPLFDPFLLLDDFRGDEPQHYIKGFPWHPHRGIETITYMLDGHVEHGDSMGNHGTIGPGDTQWMTAGSGIIHQEMPKGDPGGVMGGFQLWANLPASHKMMDPRYRDVKAGQVPEITSASGVRTRIICGQVNGETGPVQDVVIDPEYLDISVPAHTSYTHPTPIGHTVFAYVIQGQACFCDQKNPFSYDAEGAGWSDLRRSPWVQNAHLALFDDGDHLVVSTEEEPVRFLLVAGRPIREPVAWYGPIVMNTRDELRVAFEEYANGTFIKSR